MGIKYLNKHLQSNCSNSIKNISLHELSGKKIVIDTSIYLYRFLGENALLENFYLMISIFREHNILPLFIFDGKPPKEKEELLKQRKNGKNMTHRPGHFPRANLLMPWLVRQIMAALCCGKASDSFASSQVVSFSSSACS